MLTTTFLTQVQHIGVIFVLWLVPSFRLLLLCDNIRNCNTIVVVINFLLLLFSIETGALTLYLLSCSQMEWMMDFCFQFLIFVYQEHNNNKKRTAQFILFMQEGRRCWQWSLEHETYSHNTIWTLIISYNTLALSLPLTLFHWYTVSTVKRCMYEEKTYDVDV